MHQQKTDRQGLSLSTNRVALPTITSLEEVYAELSRDLDLGWLGDVEVPRMKAVLCKNGSTALTRWNITEANQTWLKDTLNVAARAGSREIRIVQASIAKDAFAGGILWLISGTGMKEHPLAFTEDTYAAQETHGNWRKFRIRSNTASATVNSVSNTVQITLDQKIQVEIPSASQVIIETSIFGNARQGTDSASKALGLNLVTVPSDFYYWAVYSGDIVLPVGALDISTVSASPLLQKSGSGRGVSPTARTAGREDIGRVKQVLTTDTTGGNLVIVTLDITGIDKIAA